MPHRTTGRAPAPTFESELASGPTFEPGPAPESAPESPPASDSGTADLVEAALEPHEPTPGETEARDRVRAEATGMTHHRAAAALESALAAAGDLAGADPAVRAEVAEWRRLTDHLLGHGGPYTPETDAYAQGQLAARHHHSP